MGDSVIVTLKVQVELEQELVAVQVTTVVPAGNADPETGEQETVAEGDPEAVGSVQVATLLSHSEMSEGHAPMTGLSFTVTENEQDDEPQPLEAVHVTDVVPVAKFDPDAGVQLTVAAGVPDEVGRVQFTSWLSHCTISEGQAPMTGLSLIVTLKVQVELEQEFVAVQVTTVVPAENVDPETGEQATVAEGTPDAVGSVHVAT